MYLIPGYLKAGKNNIFKERNMSNFKTTLSSYFDADIDNKAKFFGEAIEKKVILAAQEQLYAQFTIVHDTDGDGGCSSGMMLALLKRVKNLALKNCLAAKNKVTAKCRTLYLTTPPVSAEVKKEISESFNWEITTIPLTSGSAFASSAVRDFEETALENTAFPYYRCVIVLDHAFNFQIFKSLYEQTDLVIWIDHHKLSLHGEAFNFPVDDDKVLLYVDSDGSATKKVYDCLTFFDDVHFSHAVSTFRPLADLVDHHDSWRYGQGDERKDKEAKHLNSWFRAMPYRHEALHNVIDVYNSDTGGGKHTGDDMLRRMLEEGKSIANTRDLIALSLAENKYVVYEWLINGIPHRVSLVFHSDDMDNVAEKLLSQEGIDVAAICYLSSRSEQVRISLRSRGEIDVDVIARKFGGGGHKNAAGFEIQTALLSSLLQDSIL